MRAYLIDEIIPADMQRITAYLERNAVRSDLQNLFWVEMPEGVLSDAQRAERERAPLVFAVELGQDWIKLEFFLRDLQDLRSPSAGYCTAQQRDFVIDYAHRILESLGVKT
ncbi:MAG: hypothetical protein JW821_10240 [Deltaproteobacteria bacterium]|nr:hypothetical protein [Deltaproteobacteria bacterium]